MDPETLKDRTTTFESRAFQTANSRQEYLEHIAEGLSQLEQSHQVRNQVPLPQQQPPQPQQQPAIPQQPAAVAAAQAPGAAQTQAAIQEAHLRRQRIIMEQRRMQERLNPHFQQTHRPTQPQQPSNLQAQTQDPVRQPTVAAKRSPAVPDGKVSSNFILVAIYASPISIDCFN